MATQMTAVSLFAGVGGFDLALERSGVNVVASVEIDKKASEVLARHFPQSTLFTDVQGVTGEQLIDAGFNPSNGIITGGFPCQDLSVAGARKGLAGAQSHRSGLPSIRFITMRSSCAVMTTTVLTMKSRETS